MTHTFFSGASINGIIFESTFSNCLLLVYRNAINFFIIDFISRYFAKLSLILRICRLFKTFYILFLFY